MSGHKQTQASVKKSPDLMVMEQTITGRLEVLQQQIIGPNTQAVAGSQEVTILADREVPFSVIERVMGTCTRGGYENISLAVMQKEGVAQI